MHILSICNYIINTLDLCASFFIFMHIHVSLILLLYVDFFVKDTIHFLESCLYTHSHYCELYSGFLRVVIHSIAPSLGSLNLDYSFHEKRYSVSNNPALATEWSRCSSRSFSIYDPRI